VDTGRAKGTDPGDRFSKREWVARTGSTNTDLLAVARAGGPEQVLVADEQTAGRGRLGRSWVAPPGVGVQDRAVMLLSAAGGVDVFMGASVT